MLRSLQSKASTRRQHLKRKYAKIIRKCAALDPVERYQSAEELAGALTNKREKVVSAAVFAAAQHPPETPAAANIAVIFAVSKLMQTFADAVDKKE